VAFTVPSVSLTLSRRREAKNKTDKNIKSKA